MNCRVYSYFSPLYIIHPELQGSRFESLWLAHCSFSKLSPFQLKLVFQGLLTCPLKTDLREKLGLEQKEEGRMPRKQFSSGQINAV